MYIGTEKSFEYVNNMSLYSNIVLVTYFSQIIKFIAEKRLGVSVIDQRGSGLDWKDPAMEQKSVDFNMTLPVPLSMITRLIPQGLTGCSHDIYLGMRTPVSRLPPPPPIYVYIPPGELSQFLCFEPAIHAYRTGRPWLSDLSIATLG